jgi:hypothetical protein
MDKNIIHILLVKEKELKLSHEMTSTKKSHFNCAIKRITHVQPITFLKEKSPNHPC